MGGIRTRLAVALVGLVVVTVAAIGVGTYVFVEASLRDQLLAEARQQADFNLSVLLPGVQPAPTDAAALASSGLVEAFRLRGDVETVADFGDGDPYVSAGSLAGALDALPPSMRDAVDAGQLAYSWQPLAGRSVLVVGGRQGASPPALYFIFPADVVDAALGQLRVGLLAGGAIAAVLALLTAGAIARGILRPVHAAGEAASRIAAGDLSARVGVRGADELGRLAAEFDRMADSLEHTIGELEEAQRQNRRFVADVSHELRTPLAALVAEASLIEQGMDELSADTRRAAELLVADVRRLRVLVEDLMEISRFDADAERPEPAIIDLGALVGAVVAARLREAAVIVPPDPVIVESDPRRLDRILGNLLDNARAHAPGSPVEVALTRTPDGAEVTVADRGRGVPDDVLPRLFERFYKVDPSRRGGSSGLGLAIAAEHAALLGAELRAEARPGGGLRFVLDLPVSDTRSLPARDGPVTSMSEADGASEPAPRPEP